MSSEDEDAGQVATDEQAAQVSQQWLELASTSRDSAVETVREFIGTVERVVPGPAEQREIIESWLQSAQTLIHSQSDALRSILRDAVVVNVNVKVDPNVDLDVPTNVTVPTNVSVPTNVNVASRTPSEPPAE